jgi:hypothetical protein
LQDCRIGFVTLGVPAFSDAFPNVAIVSAVLFPLPSTLYPLPSTLYPLPCLPSARLQIPHDHLKYLTGPTRVVLGN